MGLTLIEAAKLETGNLLRQTIIRLYSGSSAILANLPFDDIPGNSLTYNREQTYPGVGFRGVNESWTPSTGVLNPLTEVLTISGGEIDIDSFIVDTMGVNQRAVQEEMKITAQSLLWTQKFIKGDTSSDKREFDGLQVRTVGDQKIAAGATANGTPLSLAKLDQALDQTLNPTHIIMSKAMRRRITAASRTAAIGGHIDFFKDNFGTQQTSYNGVPILTIDLDNEGNAILPFTEVATSGTATATSIYIVSMGGTGISGIQNGGIRVDDLGKLQSSPIYRTRVEWYSALAVFNGRAVTRLWSISDAVVTV